MNALTDPQLEADYHRALDMLHKLDEAPFDVPLPDEWFIARAAAEDHLFDLRAELVARHPEQRLALLA